ncbi:MAG: hypothetical protein ABI621_05905 [Chloroflexota bacterium]
MKAWVKKNQLISFFVLTYAIAFGTTFAYIALEPGGTLERWSLSWFLNTFSPTTSALILSAIIGGWKEVRHFLSGFTRWRVGMRWQPPEAYEKRYSLKSVDLST